MSHSSSPNGTDKVFATVVVHGHMWENPYVLHMVPIWVGSLCATHNGHMVLSS